MGKPLLLLLLTILGDAALAQDLLVSGLGSGAIHRYDGVTGEPKGIFVRGLDGPTGMAFGPDGHLYVTRINSGAVLRFDGVTGASLGTFIEEGFGSGARSLVFLPEGDLLVGYGGEAAAANRVVRFDGVTGAMIDVVASGQGMRGITSFARGPDGDLYVAAALSNEVFVFRGLSGEFVRKFTCGDRNRNLTGILFHQGKLLATASDRAAVYQYDPRTGECLGSFATTGLNVPIGIVAAPDGNVLVASLLADSVAKLDGVSGAVVTFVQSGAGGLSQPHSLTFMPAEVPAPGKRRRAVRH
jgi:DNA-binding beta-propeller fold protein YncE